MTFGDYTVRLIESADLENFYALISNNRKRLEAFFAGTVARTVTLPDTEMYLAELLKRVSKKTYLPFVIVNENGNLIGFIDVKNIDWNIPKAELGCFIDEDYQGKGVAKKAFSLLLDYLFKQLGFNKLFIRTHESNASARLIAESCGFEIEGVLRSDYKTTSGELVDLLYYGLLKP